MEKLLIDIMGTGLGIFGTLLLFETFWVKKAIKYRFFVIGILVNAAVSVVLTIYFLNIIILPVLVIALKFSLSFYFKSGITYKVLLTFLVAAIALISEMILEFILIQLLSIPIVQVQINMPLYMFAVLATNLFVLFAILIIRVLMKGRKQSGEWQFNLLMAFMPLQSIILCYVILIHSLHADIYNTSIIRIIAIILSIVLIVLTMIILNKQQKALVYKRDYEVAQARLKMQIEHYQAIYQEQQRVKSIRHDINNNLIAISGMLKENQVQEAVAQISKICDNVVKMSDTVNTGFPPIDAILSTKIAKAREFDIEIVYSILIDGELYIDQFDIAVILANALDNAIEGIIQSDNVERKVAVNISRAVEYISIFIENNATGLIYNDFQTTKPDVKNHGFGMIQMMEVAQKYNGSLRPSYDSQLKKFTLKGMLKNQQT